MAEERLIEIYERIARLEERVEALEKKIDQLINLVNGNRQFTIKLMVIILSFVAALVGIKWVITP